MDEQRSRNIRGPRREFNVTLPAAALPTICKRIAGQESECNFKVVCYGLRKFETKGPGLRTFILLLCVQLALSSGRLIADTAKPLATSNPTLAGAFQSESGLRLASTNLQTLSEVRQKAGAPLEFYGTDPYIVRLTAGMLTQQHYLGLPLNDAISSKFLDRYIETLDNIHLHFLQSDIQDFERYRTTLDELTVKQGDPTAARFIFRRFLERLDQRVTHVQELLETEAFTFTGDERYNLNRKEAPRPKNLEEARQLWRQHLRYEILQEKLAKEKPEEIAKKITRRYARLVRSFKELDAEDIFEIYLSALTHVYDPHSDYMGKRSLDNFNVGMSLSLFGIGALLQSEDGYCKIKSLVAGGPAERSNKLKENDRIIGVAQGAAEPVDVMDMKLSKVVDMIRGTKGTEVRLTVIPADAPDSSIRKVVTMIRDEIKLEDQEAKARIIDLPSSDDKTVRLGVIDLPSFYADFEADKRKDGQRKSTTTDVKKLITKLKKENVGGIILDLRRNGGGSLEEAINLTGLFIQEGPVVQVRDPGPKGKITVDDDTDPSIDYAGPLIVLTSRFSASASEILVGALQDYGRALIVGDSSTHGKGTVQSLIKLDPYFRLGPKLTNSPGALKLTIRKFYRASGLSTQKDGVTPDIVLPSVNNYAEVGEASLENPLEGDSIPSAKFDKLDLIQPLLPQLKARSEKRVASDRDYDYVREGIEQYKKQLADKTASLNEQQRIKERDEIDNRKKARDAEMKSRKDSDDKIYEITLKNADLPGLPEPVAKTNMVSKVEENKPGDPLSKVAKSSTDETQKSAAPKTDDSAKKSSSADDEDGTEDAGDPKITPVDVAMKEARRILMDLVSLWPADNALARAASPAVTKGLQ